MALYQFPGSQPALNSCHLLFDLFLIFGYLVISNKKNGKYKSIIFFNDKIFKSGVLEYDTHLDCLYETYMKLYTIYCQ